MWVQMESLVLLLWTSLLSRLDSLMTRLTNSNCARIASVALPWTPSILWIIYGKCRTREGCCGLMGISKWIPWNVYFNKGWWIRNLANTESTSSAQAEIALAFFVGWMTRSSKRCVIHYPFAGLFTKVPQCRVLCKCNVVPQRRLELCPCVYPQRRFIKGRRKIISFSP